MLEGNIIEQLDSQGDAWYRYTGLGDDCGSLAEHGRIRREEMRGTQSDTSLPLINVLTREMPRVLVRFQRFELLSPCGTRYSNIPLFQSSDPWSSTWRF